MQRATGGPTGSPFANTSTSTPSPLRGATMGSRALRADIVSTRAGPGPATLSPDHSSTWRASATITSMPLEAVSSQQPRHRKGASHLGSGSGDSDTSLELLVIALEDENERLRCALAAERRARLRAEQLAASEAARAREALARLAEVTEAQEGEPEDAEQTALNRARVEAWLHGTSGSRLAGDPNAAAAYDNLCVAAASAVSASAAALALDAAADAWCRSPLPAAVTPQQEICLHSQQQGAFPAATSDTELRGSGHALQRPFVQAGPSTSAIPELHSEPEAEPYTCLAEEHALMELDELARRRGDSDAGGSTHSHRGAGAATLPVIPTMASARMAEAHAFCHVWRRSDAGVAAGAYGRGEGAGSGGGGDGGGGGVWSSPNPARGTLQRACTLAAMHINPVHPAAATYGAGPTTTGAAGPTRKSGDWHGSPSMRVGTPPARMSRPRVATFGGADAAAWATQRVSSFGGVVGAGILGGGSGSPHPFHLQVERHRPSDSGLMHRASLNSALNVAAFGGSPVAHASSHGGGFGMGFGGVCAASASPGSGALALQHCSDSHRGSCGGASGQVFLSAPAPTSAEVGEEIMAAEGRGGGGAEWSSIPLM